MLYGVVIDLKPEGLLCNLPIILSLKIIYLEEKCGRENERVTERINTDKEYLTIKQDRINYLLRTFLPCSMQLLIYISIIDKAISFFYYFLSLNTYMLFFFLVSS